MLQRWREFTLICQLIDSMLTLLHIYAIISRQQFDFMRPLTAEDLCSVDNFSLK